jgi:hypothetical protein
VTAVHLQHGRTEGYAACGACMQSGGLVTTTLARDYVTCPACVSIVTDPQQVYARRSS